jgi:hypothetical protein
MMDVQAIPSDNGHMNSSRTLTSLILLLVSAFVPGAAASAVAPDASAASDPAAKLAVWAGRWSISEHDYETVYGHAHTNSVIADCNWTPNGRFMMCDYRNSNPSAGTPVNDLGIFSYSSAKKSYTRVGVFNDDKPVWEPMTVEGNTWTTSMEFPYKGKTIVYRNVYTFSPDDRRTMDTVQISADRGQTWTTVSRFTGVKLGP